MHIFPITISIHNFLCSAVTVKDIEDIINKYDLLHVCCFNIFTKEFINYHNCMYMYVCMK